jgi:hypothetical protein
MKNNNYPLIINKGKSFFLKESISFMDYPLFKEASASFFYGQSRKKKPGLHSGFLVNCIRVAKSISASKVATKAVKPVSFLSAV